MDEPEIWRWIWLVTAIGFASGEIAMAGTFLLAPFAVGAGAAAIVSFMGAPVGIGWGVFVAGSGVGLAGARRMAARMDDLGPNPAGVGAGRLVGEQGIVLEAVPAGPDALGLARIGREEWRAQSIDGSPIAPSTPVTVLEVRGTRVVVAPTGSPIDQPVQEGQA